ncbi:MAG: hypothetical protein Ct9H90mP6_06590 [Gammaproteobacteria bacterium]|nr:MAG: hypothetical protein Ct9H90mP6_06590 [Gammaproteobacteria bacterium]
MIVINTSNLTGHEDSITRLPDASPDCLIPFSSYSSGLTPKNGNVAEPGFVGVMPAIGEIRTEPVSVCHHVSITSQDLFPTTE